MKSDEWLNHFEEKFRAFDFEKNASNALLGYKRALPDEARKLDPAPKESAVLMLLFQRRNEWHTLFMLRPDGTGVHSNQLSFPGGKLENNETSLEAALRETFEEVGIESHDIRILGSLSPLYIPPSHFVVQPYLGVLSMEPQFTPNAMEVVKLIEFPITHFSIEPIIFEKDIFIPSMNRNVRAKYFDVHGYTLWGATAMMVQEFRSILGYYL